MEHLSICENLVNKWQDIISKAFKKTSKKFHKLYGIEVPTYLLIRNLLSNSGLYSILQPTINTTDRMVHNSTLLIILRGCLSETTKKCIKSFFKSINKTTKFLIL